MSELINLLKGALPDDLPFAQLEACCNPAEWEQDPELSAIRALAASGSFDGRDYLARYPDVAATGLDPVIHFVRHGIHEGRSFRMPGRAQAQESSQPAPKGMPATPAMPVTPAVPATISVIVTLWKRRAYIREQYRSFMRQSLKPVEIIYLINEEHITPQFVREMTGENVRILTSPINSLYTRFNLAYIAQGNYVAIMDDDTLPGELWFENAIRACNAYNAYVVGNGRILNKRGIQGFFTLVTPRPGGDGMDRLSCAHSDIFCDWGCNSYFLKREWAGLLASCPRHQDSLKTFDDIQSATSLYMAGGIKCVCPMQPQWDKRLHASLEKDWGNDDYAVWRSSSSHFADRQDYLEQLVRTGYVPVQRRPNLYRFIIIVPFAEDRRLERCLLTLKGQVYENYLCILLDDSPGGCNWSRLSGKLGLDASRFIHIRATRHLYPLRSRELATDLARARLADVVVHLDGDDWFAHPHVLWQLNRIYRTGRILATYGNMVAFGRDDTRDFREFSVFPMSKCYNMGQTEQEAAIEPMRRVRQDELEQGWIHAPWSNFHTRSFQGSRWHLIDRGHFRDADGRYLRVATDGAIFVPVLESSPRSAITFVPDISYVYQNCSNTIHASGEVTDEERQQARAAVAACGPGNTARASMVISGHQVIQIEKGDYEEFGAIEIAPEEVWPRETSASGRAILNCRNAAVTVITSDYLTEGILSIGSYRRNCQLGCDQYLFVASREPAARAAIAGLLENTGLVPLFPDDLASQQNIVAELEEKYGLSNDPYRWSMKGAALGELLARGYDAALFMDPDIYTVSDITDVQRAILCHDISVFPHFRNPDFEKTRKVLYEDGFFNGGMLGATSGGAAALRKLLFRCLREIVKDRERALFDDQKYFDLFIFDAKSLYINRDQGIDYNIWNEDAAEGIIAPTQRSYLLGSGYYARIWHLSHAYIVNAANRKSELNIRMRFVVAVYLQTKMLIALLLLLRLRANGALGHMQVLRLTARFENYEAWLNGVSRFIRFHSIRELWDKARYEGAPDIDRFLKEWSEICVNSICFDNLELFARLLESFFPESQTAHEQAWRMRRHDLRYITENVLANPGFSQSEIEARLEYASAGEIIKKRLDLLRASKIDY